MLTVLDPGVQCTLQAAPRRGYRQAGVPASGPADSVSMALANRLVGNAPDATSFEVSYGPAAFRFEAPVQIGIVGARTTVRINAVDAAMHATLDLKEGAILDLGAANAGVRIYIAVRGGLKAEEFLKSASTYLPASFGGHEGRALSKGDNIEWISAPPVAPASTPASLQLWPSNSYVLRAVPGPDWSAASAVPAEATYRVSGRASRMGVEITGPLPAFEGGGLRPSSAVFPGALQVTPNGQGFLLLADGQTTGGYPHLLQVIRADRHLLGQLRPGDRLRFVIQSQTQAEQASRAKQALLEAWMPEFRL